MTETIIQERKKDVQYEGQILITYDELAELMGLASSRIRSVLSQPNAPQPVHRGEHLHKGRVKHLYDRKAALLYFLESKKQAIKKYKYKKTFIEKGYLDESDFQV
jgi:hypothetical protein